MLIKNVASINIVRDIDKNIEYIPTPNSRVIANQIVNDFREGVRSFGIIGSYGTGKSAFILALQRHLSGLSNYFQLDLLEDANVKFINILGEFRSIKEALADHFDIEDYGILPQKIFSQIYNEYYDLGGDKKLLILFIDEFGKFLEYAFKHSAEKELYFVQQLAEFVNNSDNNILLITAVHQSFDAYSYNLNIRQQNEWIKVKGRFRELTFNEPVEQLLFLAAQQLSKAKRVGKSNEIEVGLNLFKSTKAFTHLSTDLQNVAENLYPLDLLSAHILTHALQKYGQNERSLFSFLQSTDPTSLNEHSRRNDRFYNLSHVYDYLIFNFYSYLYFYGNPDLVAWRAIKAALDLVERKVENRIEDYSSIVKTVGLLNIFSSPGALLDRHFLQQYCKICLGIEDAPDLIASLESTYKVILYRNYSTRFIVTEGTDLDIPLALSKASEKVDAVNDVTTLLNRYYKLPPVVAKEATYKSGTPRLFEFVISEYPKSIVAEGETDGYINLIFNDNLAPEELKNFSDGQKEAILFGLYKNSNAIKELLFEIEKTKKVIDENIDDKVAIKELSEILLHQQNLLNHKILTNLYNSKDVQWVFKGQVQERVVNKRTFNKLLSEICLRIYDKAPRFNNELINKHKLSGSIHSAKRGYLKALVENWDKKDLGFAPDKFPPEKTIALALLEENGIRLYDNISDHIIVDPKNQFHFIWDASEDFLNTAKVSKRKVSELKSILSQRPYKLKQGLIDFWIPTFLFIRRNEFALFCDDRYIPQLSYEVLELIIKNPEEYEVKAFDIIGVKLNLFNSYRTFLNQSSEIKPGNQSFIETIKPFLSFYRHLPEYSKNTNRLSKEAKQVRDVISKAKDPEQTFFEAFPSALGFDLNQLLENESKLHQYTEKLQDAVRELRSAYDELLARIEEFICSEILGEEMEFLAYKSRLRERFQGIKKHLLLPRQKRFLQRLESDLDDKRAWLNSIMQPVTGNTLDKFSDEEEIRLYDQFELLILELDSLTSLSQTNFSIEKEDLLSLEISSFDAGLCKRIIRLPKSRSQEVEKVEVELRRTLSNNTITDLAALSKILKELMEK
ncbi:hypothetical protein [Desertivirga xinjiangensis]|uniref:hypothetical protein n=1 Tax=Desertivirga xinjiangensis TaxID=539206 RepID=UPI00210B5846|nr:hypothetical protein [Pedobacter xinjiangensis]